MITEKKKPNGFAKWFFKAKFSYFDLICIFIGIQIGDWLLSHLVWR